MCQEGLRQLALTDTPHSQYHTYTHTSHLCPLTDQLLTLLHLSCYHFSHIHTPQTGLGSAMEGSSVRAETL